MVRVGVLLSGCGVYDGAEIHESVLTLLALERAGVEVVCMAPDIDQRHVIDHQTGDPAPETRNVRVESARIARGPVRDVAEVGADELDALVLPGGFGAAKNLCSFAVDGADSVVDPGVARLMGAMLDAGKPQAVACIAPAVMATVVRDRGESVELTIGNEPGAIAALEAMGVRHVTCDVRSVHVDRERRVVSTPAYMLAANVCEAADGIEAMVRELLALVGADARTR
ncbi:isoprenoid biosynthesis glyoxalase ElbB [Engelhardtia mirabilis]|uniref:Enhancing lycopene biosynthesis protein 2 n=1 Tax=Engelhardtia mirabilis TaxID=2528011 RepID=A0A518BIH0_9BACT|nr:Enhancing lycopene biosynthesis protein 2 [Planctomycetes bacterium Pla133]QDV01103.1 Enhancing lycopene biosynthesis protein 2 [Planctomycetes bacterium Pla86]